MSEKLEKWLKNEDFEKERQEYARNLIHTENLLDKYMEYAHNLTVEERSNFIQKCIDKYEELNIDYNRKVWEIHDAFTLNENKDNFLEIVR